MAEIRGKRNKTDREIFERNRTMLKFPSFFSHLPPRKETEPDISSPWLPKRFTLIEMLIVISIIATLAAMLSPALHRALAASYQSTCQSNLRQTGLAYAQYGNDYNDWIMPTSYNSSVGWFWWRKLQKLGYMGSTTLNTAKNGIFVCSAHSDAAPTDPSTSYNIADYCSYGVNMNVCSPYDPRFGNAAKFRENAHKFNELTRFKKKISGTIIVCDTKRAENTPTDTAPHYSCEKDPLDPGTPQYRLPLRHNFGTNFLYADGHCAKRAGPFGMPNSHSDILTTDTTH